MSPPPVAPKPLSTAALHRIGRDLLWLVTTKPLIAPPYWSEAGTHAASCLGWTLPSVSPAVMQPVAAQLAMRGAARLGTYFEALHGVLLHAQPEIGVLALNHVIGNGGLTIGELDCLYRAGDGAVVHREVAVKYYLAQVDSAQPEQWVGPRKVDRLDMKLDRMAQHQVKLPRNAQARDLWPRNLPYPDRSEVLLCGALFKHPRFAAWPTMMDPEADTGFWCSGHDLLSQTHAKEPWCVLHKPWWLSVSHGQLAPSLSLHELVEQVQAQSAPLLATPASADSPLYGQRGFIVPNDWESR